MAPQCSRAELEYRQFALRITEDINRNELYTNKEIKGVFTSHIEANRGKLDLNKMLEQVELLRRDLDVSEYDLLTELKNSQSTVHEVPAHSIGDKTMKLQQMQLDSALLGINTKTAKCNNIENCYCSNENNNINEDELTRQIKTQEQITGNTSVESFSYVPETPSPVLKSSSSRNDKYREEIQNSKLKHTLNSQNNDELNFEISKDSEEENISSKEEGIDSSKKNEIDQLPSRKSDTDNQKDNVNVSSQLENLRKDSISKIFANEIEIKPSLNDHRLNIMKQDALINDQEKNGKKTKTITISANDLSDSMNESKDTPDDFIDSSSDFVKKHNMPDSIVIRKSIIETELKQKFKRKLSIVAEGISDSSMPARPLIDLKGEAQSSNNYDNKDSRAKMDQKSLIENTTIEDKASIKSNSVHDLHAKRVETETYSVDLSQSDIERRVELSIFGDIEQDEKNATKIKAISSKGLIPEKKWYSKMFTRKSKSSSGNLLSKSNVEFPKNSLTSKDLIKGSDISKDLISVRKEYTDQYTEVNEIDLAITLDIPYVCNCPHITQEQRERLMNKVHLKSVSCGCNFLLEKVEDVKQTEENPKKGEKNIDEPDNSEENVLVKKWDQNIKNPSDLDKYIETQKSNETAKKYNSYEPVRQQEKRKEGDSNSLTNLSLTDEILSTTSVENEFSAAKHSAKIVVIGEPEYEIEEDDVDVEEDDFRAMPKHITDTSSYTTESTTLPFETVNSIEDANDKQQTVQSVIEVKNDDVDVSTKESTNLVVSKTLIESKQNIENQNEAYADGTMNAKMQDDDVLTNCSCGTNSSSCACQSSTENLSENVCSCGTSEKSIISCKVSKASNLQKKSASSTNAVENIFMNKPQNPSDYPPEHFRAERIETEDDKIEMKPRNVSTDKDELYNESEMLCACSQTSYENKIFLKPDDNLSAEKLNTGNSENASSCKLSMINEERTPNDSVEVVSVNKERVSEAGSRVDGREKSLPDVELSAVNKHVQDDIRDSVTPSVHSSTIKNTLSVADTSDCECEELFRSKENDLNDSSESFDGVCSCVSQELCSSIEDDGSFCKCDDSYKTFVICRNGDVSNTSSVKCACDEIDVTVVFSTIDPMCECCDCEIESNAKEPSENRDRSIGDSNILKPQQVVEVCDYDNNKTHESFAEIENALNVHVSDVANEISQEKENPEKKSISAVSNGVSIEKEEGSRFTLDIINKELEELVEKCANSGEENLLKKLEGEEECTCFISNDNMLEKEVHADNFDFSSLSQFVCDNTLCPEKNNPEEPCTCVDSSEVYIKENESFHCTCDVIGEVASKTKGSVEKCANSAEENLRNGFEGDEECTCFISDDDDVIKKEAYDDNCPDKDSLESQCRCAVSNEVSVEEEICSCDVIDEAASKINALSENNVEETDKFVEWGDETEIEFKTKSSEYMVDKKILVNSYNDSAGETPVKSAECPCQAGSSECVSKMHETGEWGSNIQSMNISNMNTCPDIGVCRNEENESNSDESLFNLYTPPLDCPCEDADCVCGKPKRHNTLETNEIVEFGKKSDVYDVNEEKPKSDSEIIKTSVSSGDLENVERKRANELEQLDIKQSKTDLQNDKSSIRSANENRVSELSNMENERKLSQNRTNLEHTKEMLNEADVERYRDTDNTENVVQENTLLKNSSESSEEYCSCENVGDKIELKCECTVESNSNLRENEAEVNVECEIEPKTVSKLDSSDEECECDKSTDEEETQCECSDSTNSEELIHIEPPSFVPVENNYNGDENSVQTNNSRNIKKDAVDIIKNDSPSDNTEEGPNTKNDTSQTKIYPSVEEIESVHSKTPTNNSRTINEYAVDIIKNDYPSDTEGESNNKNDTSQTKIYPSVEEIESVHSETPTNNSRTINEYAVDVIKNVYPSDTEGESNNKNDTSQTKIYPIVKEMEHLYSETPSPTQDENQENNNAEIKTEHSSGENLEESGIPKVNSLLCACELLNKRILHVLEQIKCINKNSEKLKVQCNTANLEDRFSTIVRKRDKLQNKIDQFKEKCKEVIKSKTEPCKQAGKSNSVPCLCDVYENGIKEEKDKACVIVYIAPNDKSTNEDGAIKCDDFCEKNTAELSTQTREQKHCCCSRKGERKISKVRIFLKKPPDCAWKFVSENKTVKNENDEKQSVKDGYQNCNVITNPKSNSIRVKVANPKVYTALVSPHIINENLNFMKNNSLLLAKSSTKTTKKKSNSVVCIQMKKSNKAEPVECNTSRIYEFSDCISSKIKSRDSLSKSELRNPTTGFITSKNSCDIPDSDCHLSVTWDSKIRNIPLELMQTNELLNKIQYYQTREEMELEEKLNFADRTEQNIQIEEITQDSLSMVDGKPDISPISYISKFFEIKGKIQPQVIFNHSNQMKHHNERSTQEDVYTNSLNPYTDLNESTSTASLNKKSCTELEIQTQENSTENKGNIHKINTPKLSIDNRLNSNSADVDLPIRLNHILYQIKNALKSNSQTDEEILSTKTILKNCETLLNKLIHSGPNSTNEPGHFERTDSSLQLHKNSRTFKNEKNEILLTNLTMSETINSESESNMERKHILTVNNGNMNRKILNQMKKSSIEIDKDSLVGRTNSHKLSNVNNSNLNRKTLNQMKSSSIEIDKDSLVGRRNSHKLSDVNNGNLNRKILNQMKSSSIEIDKDSLVGRTNSHKLSNVNNSNMNRKTLNQMKSSSIEINKDSMVYRRNSHKLHNVNNGNLNRNTLNQMKSSSIEIDKDSLVDRTDLHLTSFGCNSARNDNSISTQATEAIFLNEGKENSSANVYGQHCQTNVTNIPHIYNPCSSTRNNPNSSLTVDILKKYNNITEPYSNSVKINSTKTKRNLIKSHLGTEEKSYCSVNKNPKNILVNCNTDSFGENRKKYYLESTDSSNFTLSNYLDLPERNNWEQSQEQNASNAARRGKKRVCSDRKKEKSNLHDYDSNNKTINDNKSVRKLARKRQSFKAPEETGTLPDYLKTSVQSSNVKYRIGGNHSGSNISLASERYALQYMKKQQEIKMQEEMAFKASLEAVLKENELTFSNCNI